MKNPATAAEHQENEKNLANLTALQDATTSFNQASQNGNYKDLVDPLIQLGKAYAGLKDVGKEEDCFHEALKAAQSDADRLKVLSAYSKVQKELNLSLSPSDQTDLENLQSQVSSTGRQEQNDTTNQNNGQAQASARAAIGASPDQPVSGQISKLPGNVGNGQNMQTSDYFAQILTSMTTPNNLLALLNGENTSSPKNSIEPAQNVVASAATNAGGHPANTTPSDIGSRGADNDKTGASGPTSGADKLALAKSAGEKKSIASSSSRNEDVNDLLNIYHTNQIICGPYSSEVGSVALRLAEYYKKTPGCEKLAEGFYNQALVIYDRPASPDNRELARVLMGYGQLIGDSEMQARGSRMFEGEIRDLFSKKTEKFSSGG